MSFMIETSARHIHLTQETLEKLFGEGYELFIQMIPADAKTDAAKVIG
jgi:propanediol utilization protein